MLGAAVARVNLNWPIGAATVWAHAADDDARAPDPLFRRQRAAMRLLTIVATALWLGAMGFFALVVAPAAFGTLDREAAGRLVSAVFPRYYAVGLALGLAALLGLGARWTGGMWRSLDWLPLGLVVLMLALTLYAGAVVLPAAHAAREVMRQAGADPSAAAAFARLHRLSGILNAIVMVSGVVVVVVEMARRR